MRELRCLVVGYVLAQSFVHPSLPARAGSAEIGKHLGAVSHCDLLLGWAPVWSASTTSCNRIAQFVCRMGNKSITPIVRFSSRSIIFYRNVSTLRAHVFPPFAPK